MSRGVEEVLDVMENAADDWQQPLTRERLCAWQAALFPAASNLRSLVVGEYRSNAEPMQIVSGPHGREIVHYQAVAGSAVRAEMHAFLEWFNRTAELDGLLRAGLAHVWFESIHPFDDGNGRIGRAIVGPALARDARRSSRLLGVSAAMRHRAGGVLRPPQRRASAVTVRVTPSGWSVFWTRTPKLAARARR